MVEAEALWVLYDGHVAIGLSLYVDMLVWRPDIIDCGMPYGYSLLFIGIEKWNKGLATAGLKGELSGCGGISATCIDDTTGAVVLTGVEMTASSTIDLTGFSTILWGLFYELELSMEGCITFGYKKLQFLNTYKYPKHFVHAEYFYKRKL